MAEKYQNKYRIASARLKNWDYRTNAAYFLTICTKNMTHYFGKIINGKMELSPIGELAHQFWAEIPQHFPFVKLDAFIIMPNHVHGIIIIDNDDCDSDDCDALQTLQCNASSANHPPKNAQMQKISPKSGSISTIIRSYKSVTTKHARKINIDFEWQTRFYDHIIKNDQSFHNIHRYICNNPQKWAEDKFHKTC
jgi:REP element-mobilizing transposase RayT